jgi:hypothetical protein
MKVGTLVEHRTWGKGIVTEILTSVCCIRICWLNPKSRDSGVSIVWPKEVTIISEGE